MFVKEQEAGKARLKVREELSIYDAVGVRDALMDCLENQSGVELDLSEVSECDAAGLQLLCAARRSAAQRRKSFRVVESSPAISAAIEKAGLNSGDVLGELN